MFSMSSAPRYTCRDCLIRISGLHKPNAIPVHSAQWRKYSYFAPKGSLRLTRAFAHWTKEKHDSSPDGLRMKRQSRKLRSLDQGDELVPSKPSPPLSNPARTWAAEIPITDIKMQSDSTQDWNWYWETIPPSFAQKLEAQHFFVKDASPRFLQSVAAFRTFPESDVPEVAFVGRSNVGKSSLLNAIVNADTKALLARTSSTPGFTKTMNLYGVGPNGGVVYKKQPSGFNKLIGKSSITIVDMPGYGEGSLSQWGVEIMKYLQARKQLRRVFVLIDAKHGIKDKDRSLLASLRMGGIPHQVILSKLDKIYIPEAKEIKRFDGRRMEKFKPKGNIEDLRKTMEKIREEIKPQVGGGALGEILGCSSEIVVDGQRLGIDAVRFSMLQATGFNFRSGAIKIEDGSKGQRSKSKTSKIKLSVPPSPVQPRIAEPTVSETQYQPSVSQSKVRDSDSVPTARPIARADAASRRAARRAGRPRL